MDDSKEVDFQKKKGAYFWAQEFRSPLFSAFAAKEMSANLALLKKVSLKLADRWVVQITGADLSKEEAVRSAPLVAKAINAYHRRQLLDEERADLKAELAKNPANRQQLEDQLRILDRRDDRFPGSDVARVLVLDTK